MKASKALATVESRFFNNSLSYFEIVSMLSILNLKNKAQEFTLYLSILFHLAKMEICIKINFKKGPHLK